MRIVQLNPPYRAPWLGPDDWITVPPQGYGGVQWYVANLIDGLLELGHELVLLGAPGSSIYHQNITVVDAGTPADIDGWLASNSFDVIHDHSNGAATSLYDSLARRWISTFHLTGTPRHKRNAVYVSTSQKNNAEGVDAPVLRVPVNCQRYRYRRNKESFLLFIGRFSPWKGVMEAAQFSKCAGKKLIAAGPVWERDYFESLMSRYEDVLEYLGEVGGDTRLNLLANACAVLVMSQPVEGPWGQVWSEPGATVVSEAAASGTPVISTDNGCLSEICPLVGQVLPVNTIVTPSLAKQTIKKLPPSDKIRSVALIEWSHNRIAHEYEKLYKRVAEGESWE